MDRKWTAQSFLVAPGPHMDLTYNAPSIGNARASRAVDTAFLMSSQHDNSEFSYQDGSHTRRDMWIEFEDERRRQIKEAATPLIRRP